MVEPFSLFALFSTFTVLFAVIDIPGVIPMMISLEDNGKVIKPFKAFLYSLIIYLIFYYTGTAFLHLFGVDISSFAVAGSIILFFISLDMILDLKLTTTKKSKQNDATITPVVFPFIVGAGSITTLLSLKAHFVDSVILAALLLNMIFVYFVLKNLRRIGRFLGENVTFALQKLFGIIILTIAVKIFTENLVKLIENMS